MYKSFKKSIAVSIIALFAIFPLQNVLYAQELTLDHDAHETTLDNTNSTPATNSSPADFTTSDENISPSSEAETATTKTESTKFYTSSNQEVEVVVKWKTIDLEATKKLYNRIELAILETALHARLDTISEANFEIITIEGVDLLFVHIPTGNNKWTKVFASTKDSIFKNAFKAGKNGMPPKSFVETKDFTPTWIQGKAVKYNEVTKDGELIGYTIKTAKPEFGWYYVPVLRYPVNFIVDTNEHANFKVFANETISKEQVTDPVKQGYNFEGWYTDENFQEPFEFDKTPIIAETKVFAKFTEQHEVIIDEKPLPDVENPNTPSLPTQPQDNSPCVEEGHEIVVDDTALSDASGSDKCKKNEDEKGEDNPKQDDEKQNNEPAENKDQDANKKDDDNKDKKDEEKKKDEKPAPAVSSGGNGGGGSSYIPVNISHNSTAVAVKNTEVEVKGDTAVRENPSVIFNNFTKQCTQSVKNLTDARLIAYYDDLKVVNRENLNRWLTRAEFLKLVLNAANINVEKESSSTFTDVSTEHTLKNYIVYATRTGIVAGQDNMFRPDDIISRAEAAKIFVKTAGIKLSTEVTTFSDVAKTHSLAQYIQTAFDNCLLNGRKTFNGESLLKNGVRVYEPESAITLAETAKVLYNITHQ